MNGTGFGLVYYVLGLGFEAQVLGLGLGLEGEVLGLGLGLRVLDSNTGTSYNKVSQSKLSRVIVVLLSIQTRSFAIAKRTARRSSLVDLVHCQHCFLRHMA